jgi:hypothetical protein
MSIQKCIINTFTILFSIHKSFYGIASFYFPRYDWVKFLIYFCDVFKMVIIHKKIITFGYKQVV